MVKKKKVSAGLDTGDGAIRLVALSGRLPEVEMVALGVARITAGEERSNIIKAIKKTVAACPVQIKEASVAVMGQPVFVRYIELPRMSKDDLSQAIRYEAEQHIPFKIDDVVFDYQVLEEGADQNKMRVLLAAAKKELIQEQLDIAKEAELGVSSIDTVSFSLINCFELNGPEVKENEVIALLGLGNEVVDINILRGRVPYFTRQITVGVDSADEMHDISSPSWISIVNEVRVSFDHYENQSERGIDSIYISGSLSKIDNIDTFLSEHLDLKVSKWDPHRNIKVGNGVDTGMLNDEGASLAVGIGLALRGLA
jgi:type IV pilus assembly protein PilM